MADINYDEDRWWVARPLLRYLVEGLIQLGSTWMASPPLLPPQRGTRAEQSHRDLACSDIAEEPRLPVGHPERLVPLAAPTGAERLLWRQLEDSSRWPRPPSR